MRSEVDVDHVLVGPGGVVVVETKWSADAWPFGDPHGFMADRLADAVRAARRNAVDVTTLFRRELDREVVRPLVVVWSPAEAADQLDQCEVDGVVVVRGHALRRWLGGLTSGHLDDAGVTRAWSHLDKQARVRDARDAKSGGIRPTALQVLSRWLGQPLIGFVAAVYAFVAILTAHDPRLSVLGLLVIGLACLAGLRREGSRPASLGGAVAVIILASSMLLALVGP